MGDQPAQPTELQKALVDEFCYLRGRIIGSYAQVEFLLADFAVKLDLRFPYRIEARIKAVKDIAGRKGFEAYKDDLNNLCDELSQFDDFRHFAAHGFATCIIGEAGTHQFELRRYERIGEGEFHLLLGTTTVDRMRLCADDLVRYVSEANRLFEKIYRERKLE